MSSAVRTLFPRASWRRALPRLADESGAVAVEYGLIAALVALTILGTLVGVRDALVALPLQSLIDAFIAAVS